MWRALLPLRVKPSIGNIAVPQLEDTVLVLLCYYCGALLYQGLLEWPNGRCGLVVITPVLDVWQHNLYSHT